MFFAFVHPRPANQLSSPNFSLAPAEHFIRSLTIILSIILLSLFCQDVKAQQQPGQTNSQQLWTGHENHKVTLQYGASLTKNFRKMTDASTSTILGEYFGKDALVEALNQEHCVGLRIYYGKKDDGTPALVLVGVDGSGSDMTQGLVLEDGLPCPPFCWEDGALSAHETTASLSELNSSPDVK